MRRSFGGTWSLPPKKLFVLDTNFPEPIVDALAPFITDATLVPIRAMGAGWSEWDDDVVIGRLAQHAIHWAGLITTDDDMVSDRAIMTALFHARIALIIAAAAGHNPLKASGLVLTHLPWICKNMPFGSPSIYRLATSNPECLSPIKKLDRLAQHDKGPATARRSPSGPHGSLTPGPKPRFSTRGVLGRSSWTSKLIMSGLAPQRLAGSGLRSIKRLISFRALSDIRHTEP